jgi:hypothetical protein
MDPPASSPPSTPLRFSFTPLPHDGELKLAWVRAEYTATHPDIHRHLHSCFADVTILQPAFDDLSAALQERVRDAFQVIRGASHVWTFPGDHSSPHHGICQWAHVRCMCTLDWVKNNIEILYGKDQTFRGGTPSELDGLILWFDPNHRSKVPPGHPGAHKLVEKKSRPFKLLEGNHRICAWRLQDHPAAIRVSMFIGYTRSEAAIVLELLRPLQQ